MGHEETAIYFATDKDIYDLIKSSKVHYSDAKLRAMLRERGIIVSSEMEREDLARYFSTIPHDYHSFNVLLDQLPQRSSFNKKQTTRIMCDANLGQLQTIVNQLKNERESCFKDIYSVGVGTDSIDVDVHYTEMDYSRTRLRQKRTKDARFEVIVDSGEIKIRSDSADKMTEIVRDLESRIERSFNNVSVVRISLDNVLAAKDISKFFIQLASTIPTYTIADVMTIKLEKLEDITGIADIDDSGVDPEAYEHGVKKAILSGDTLLNSPEFRSLSGTGFFVSSIRWISKDNGLHHKYEFSASFDQYSDGRDLTYSVDGIYKYKGNNEYNVTRKHVENIERKKLLKDLENHAVALLTEISGENR